MEAIETRQHIGRKRASSGEPTGASPLKRTTSLIEEEPFNKDTTPELVDFPEPSVLELLVPAKTQQTYEARPSAVQKIFPPQTPSKPKLPKRPIPAPVTMATQTTPGTIGVHPDKFDGSPLRAEKFLADCKIYLDCNKHLYTDDASKILLFVSLCEKGAEGFALAQYRKGRGNLGNFNDFKDAFKKHFISTDSEDQARIQIQNVKQTGKVADYITHFKLLKDQAKITEEQALRIPFLRGLKENIYKQLVKKFPFPKTLNDMMEACTEIEQSQNMIRDLRDGVWIPPNSKPAKDPYAMDVDNLQINRGQLQRPSMNKQQLMDEGRCFKCGEKGHRAAQCIKEEGGYQPRYQQSYRGRRGQQNYRGRGGYQNPRGGFCKVLKVHASIPERRSPEPHMGDPQPPDRQNLRLCSRCAYTHISNSISLITSPFIYIFLYTHPWPLYTTI